MDYVQSFNGRSLDNKLIKNEDAKEYTSRKHRKEFGKKKEIDAFNEIRPNKDLWCLCLIDIKWLFF